jgi:hypothetical protein
MWPPLSTALSIQLDRSNMNVWVRRSVQTALLAGGLMAMTATSAFAAGPNTGGVTDGSHSILGGNQLIAAVNAPVNVTENAIGVLGRAIVAGGKHGGGSGSGHTSAPNTGGVTDGSHSAGGGNQVIGSVNSPVNVSNNAVGNAIVGKKPAVKAPKAAGKDGPNTGGVTDGTDSIGGGNQVIGGVNAPVNVSNNAIAGLGRAWVPAGTSKPASGGQNVGGVTDGSHSILGGNQVIAGVNAPVNVSNNAIGVLGVAGVLGH